MLSIKQILIALGFSAIGVTGCSQADKQSVYYSSDDYAVMAQIADEPTNEYELYSHIDKVLGLKNLSYLHFLNEVTPYTQITLDCIHSGSLKLDHTKSQHPKVIKSEGLDSCIKTASEKPLMLDILLTHSNGWNIEKLSTDPEVKQLIEEAKKDNVLTAIEFMKIGSIVEFKALHVAETPSEN